MSKHEPSGPWIGVDLDGTLAEYNGWQGVDHIGPPIEAMANRVHRWLADGRRVKIFTARMEGHNLPSLDFSFSGETVGVVDVVTPIQDWTEKHFGVRLEVTNIKDMNMEELWDDRARRVQFNTGLEYNHIIL